MDVLDQDKPHYALVIVPLISLMSDIKEKFELKGVEVGPIYCLYTKNKLFCMNEFIQSEKIANLKKKLHVHAFDKYCKYMYIS